MDDEEKTKEQLIGELITLRQQLAESEKSEGPAGLHNDGYFQQRLDEEVARSSRYGLELSLIMLDIDNFEMYSKRSGQVMVDEALQLAGGTVRDCTRQVDIACHYGGSKFAIILPHTGSSGAIVVAERLRQAMPESINIKSHVLQHRTDCQCGHCIFPYR